MSNDNFWTDERVIEFEIFKRGHEILNYPKSDSISELIEQFKASKQVKEWEVVEHFKKDWFGSPLWYDTKTLQPIDVGQRIKSVKRLSDGEVFTVGEVTEQCAIEKFTPLTTGGLIAVTSSGIGHNIRSIKKKRTALFKTADGKEICLGDSFCIVHEKYDITEHKAINEDQKPIVGKAYFSTREAAEEYAKLNRPQFSVKDFKDAFPAMDRAEADFYNNILLRLKHSKGL